MASALKEEVNNMSNNRGSVQNMHDFIAPFLKSILQNQKDLMNQQAAFMNAILCLLEIRGIKPTNE